MLFPFLLVVHAIIAAMLVTVILLQKSEGGGLTGGSPSGFMSARGAADLLTRGTAVLATLFVAMSILLAVLAATRHSGTIDTSLARQPAPVDTSAAPIADAPSEAEAAGDAVDAEAPAEDGVPLAQ